MKTEFPFIPLLIQGAAGGLDGVIASSDLNAGRTSLTKQRAVWLQAGLAVLGLAGEFAGIDADYTEPLMGSAIVLAGRELGFKAAAVPPQAYQAFVNPPGNGRVMQPGVSGWRETQPAGLSG
jgi:hypothetical protein